MCICASSRLLVALILVVSFLCVAPAEAPGADAAKASAAAPEIEADLVLEGAAVYTVDRARTWAEAVAIRGDEILYVGGNQGAARYVGPKTRVVNLAGKMVLPGFQDAHLHPLWAGVEQLHCTLYDLRDARGLRARGGRMRGDATRKRSGSAAPAGTWLSSRVGSRPGRNSTPWSRIGRCFWPRRTGTRRG